MASPLALSILRFTPLRAKPPSATSFRGITAASLPALGGTRAPASVHLSHHGSSASSNPLPRNPSLPLARRSAQADRLVSSPWTLTGVRYSERGRRQDEAAFPDPKVADRRERASSVVRGLPPT